MSLYLPVYAYLPVSVCLSVCLCLSVFVEANMISYCYLPIIMSFCHPSIHLLLSTCVLACLYLGYQVMLILFSIPSSLGTVSRVLCPAAVGRCRVLN